MFLMGSYEMHERVESIPSTCKPGRNECVPMDYPDKDGYIYYFTVYYQPRNDREELRREVGDGIDAIPYTDYVHVWGMAKVLAPDQLGPIELFERDEYWACTAF